MSPGPERPMGLFPTRGSAGHGRSATILVALAAIFALAIILGGHWLRMQHLRQERDDAAAVINPLADSLDGALDRRVGLLRGYAAFVTSELQNAPDGQLPARFQLDSRRLTAALRETTPGIRDIAVRPGSAEFARPVLASRDVVAIGPTALVQGGQGIVLQAAISHGGRQWGSAEMTVDFETILKQAGLDARIHGYDVALRNEVGIVALGDGATFDDAVLRTIRLGDTTWTLALRPTAGWLAASRQYLHVFHATTGAAACLLLAMIFLLLRANVMLGRRVREQTAAIRDSESAAHAARQRLEVAIESIPAGFALFDHEDRLTISNRTYRAISGLGDELLRRGVSFEEIIRASVRDGSVLVERGQEERFIADQLMRHRDPTGPFEQRTSGDGWVRVEERRTSEGGVVVIHSDITERKRSELELARNSLVLQSILDTIGEGLSVVDADKRLIAWNRNLSSIAQIDPAMLKLGTPIRDIMLSQARAGTYGDIDPEVEVDRRLTSDWPPTPIVLQRDLPDGRKLEIRRRPTGDGGWVALYADVSERERATAELARSSAAADAANRAKSDFLATMSHEVRTPLNGIIGMCGLLADTSLDPGQRHKVETIRASSEALRLIVNDVLDFSKLEARKLQIEAAAFAVDDLIAGALDLVAPQANAKGLALKRRIADGVPGALIGDLGRLRQILLNLLSNAVKFTTRGTIVLAVDVIGGDPERPTLRLTVTDTGPGIPPGMKLRLFRRFEQGDVSISRRFGGTGLGLAICRELVELMGGRIDCDSEEGIGSRFWFEVSLPVAPGLVRRQAALSPPAAQPTRRLRLLLAEDNRVNQQVASLMLEHLGHHVDLANDGAEALRAVETLPYDLVLMDINMPNMNGIEAARGIRALPGAAGRVPIVALTAFADSEAIARFRAAGMDFHVAKPIDRAAFVQLITHLADRDSPSARTAVASPPDPAAEIDEALVGDLVNAIGSARMALLVANFAVTARKHLTELAAAVEQRDGAMSRWHAHALAGTFATFGLPRLAATARAIEMAAKSSAHPSIDVDMGTLATVVPVVLSRLEQRFPAIGTA